MIVLDLGAVMDQDYASEFEVEEVNENDKDYIEEDDAHKIEEIVEKSEDDDGDRFRLKW